jgi:hypothetical protein
MKGRENTTKSYWHGAILPTIIFLCFFLLLYLGISNVSTSAEKQNRRIVQDALYRSVVQCYAIEGMYPPDIQYLKDHYGLVYNHDQFIIHYEAFAANILPSMIVIDKYAE